MAHTTLWNLKFDILRAGRTQRQVAEVLGKDPAWLSRVIHGEKTAGPEDRKRLSELLGKPEAELFA